MSYLCSVAVKPMKTPKAKKKSKKAKVRECIYTVVIFMLDKVTGDAKEMHNHGWFPTAKLAEEYLRLSGTPVPGQEGVYYEDPFECRWTHALIEEVPWGPMCVSKVLSWWVAKWRKTDHKVLTHTSCGVRQLKKAPFKGADSCFNYSGF
jgi:hypothetical protein